MGDQIFLKISFGACRECGTVHGHQLLKFKELRESGLSIPQALERLGVGTMCCMNLFQSPDYFPKLGPRRIQMQYQRELQIRQERLTELEVLLQNLPGVTLESLDSANMIELNRLGLWLGRTLGDPSGVVADDEVLVWGGRISEPLYTRIQTLLDQPQLPEWLITKLDSLKAMLEPLNLTLEDLVPNEAVFVRRNLERAQRRYNLELEPSGDLAVDFQTAQDQLVKKGASDKMLWTRSIHPQRLFQTLEDRLVAALDPEDPDDLEMETEVLQTQLDQIRTAYRDIAKRVQGLVPGFAFQPLVERISSIPQGQLAEEFLTKGDHFLELVDVTEFPISTTHALSDLRRIYELRADLVNDSTASLQQISESMGSNSIQGDQTVHVDLLNSANTAMIVPPPSGVRTVMQRIKLTELGMDPISGHTGKASASQLRQILKLG